VEEAIKDAKINLEVHLGFLKEDGFPIPVPEDIDYFKKYSGKISLRLGKKLHKEVACFADKDGVSINSLILMALSCYVGLENYNYKLEERIDCLHQISIQGIKLQINNNDILNGWKILD
jgi:predicted HicB family RNase H-like nuclease